MCQHCLADCQDATLTPLKVYPPFSWLLLFLNSTWILTWDNSLHIIHIHLKKSLATISLMKGWCKWEDIDKLWNMLPGSWLKETQYKPHWAPLVLYSLQFWLTAFTHSHQHQTLWAALVPSARLPQERCPTHAEWGWQNAGPSFCTECAVIWSIYLDFRAWERTMQFSQLFPSDCSARLECSSAIWEDIILANPFITLTLAFSLEPWLQIWTITPARFTFL